MKKHFNYDISFEQLQGRMPPANTPCDKQPIVHVDNNVHVLWPNDQIYYSAKELKQLTEVDYFNHPLVSHLKPLIHRKPVQYSMRRYEDPLVMEKKKEILSNLSWLSYQNINESQTVKEFKFRLNQLSESNYGRISKFIMDVIQENQQIPYIEELITIAANQNKFRGLYSQLLRELIKQTNTYEQLQNYLQNFIEYKENYEEYQNSLDDDTLIILNKRKQLFIGKYKFIVHLYKDNVIEMYFINKSIIELFNKCIYLLNNTKFKSFFVDEVIEGLLEIITAIKNDLFIKQYKDDVRLEKDFISFYQNPNNKKQWNKPPFRFSKGGIQFLLKWIEKQEVSQRIKLLIANLLEKLQNNWKVQKQSQKKKQEITESSDSEREELTFSAKKPSVKLQVQNLELINEEPNDYSVSKQFTTKQINQFIEKLFTQKLDEYRIELLKLYTALKTCEQILAFWSCYLKLISRITRDNCSRVEITFQLYELTQEEFIKELILQQLQDKISQIIYDIIDSNFGTLYLTKLIQSFLKQNLKNLQIIQVEQNEETQKYIMILLPQLISSTQLSIIENAEHLQNYLINQLQLTNEQQQQMWSGFL